MQRVGAGPLVDGHGNGAALVEIGTGCVIGGTQLDTGNVAQADDTTVLATLDDDTLEGIGLDKAARGLDRQFECGCFRGRLLVELTGGNLHVLGPQRGQNLARRHIERGNPFRVEPDTHGVFTATEQADLTHAVETGELVTHTLRGTGDIEVIAAAIGGEHMHHQQQVGRCLLGDHTEAADGFGQAWLSNRDTVLHQNLRRIQIGAEVKGNGNGQVAIAGCLAGEIEHPFDTIDLLLQRGCHCFSNGFSRGTGILGRHLYGWRCHFGVLGNRQGEIGQRTDNGQEGRDHDREDRSINKKLGELHLSFLTVGPSLMRVMADVGRNCCCRVASQRPVRDR